MSDEHEKRRDHVVAVSGIHQCLAFLKKLRDLSPRHCSEQMQYRNEILTERTDVYGGFLEKCGLAALFENYISHSESQNVHRSVFVEEASPEKKEPLS